MNENGKVNENLKAKECEPNEHYYAKVPNSAWIPLEDGTGLGFKTWACEHCGKKVKSS